MISLFSGVFDDIVVVDLKLPNHMQEINNFESVCYNLTRFGQQMKLMVTIK